MGSSESSSAGDLAREIRIATEAAAVFDFSFRTALRFTGDDRQSFLHNLLSNDVASLTPGTGIYATLLTQQSKVVTDAYVFCSAESLRVELDRALAPRARQHLESFLVADDVEIEDLTGREREIGLFGPKSTNVLQALNASIPDPALAHRTTQIAGAPVWIARIDWIAEPCFEIVADPEHAEPVLSALRAAAESVGGGLAGSRALDVLRLEAGLPWPGVDFDERYLVLEAGLERGIHFRKGCYLGQEVVERASSRGHVNRRLVGLVIDGDRVPDRGAAITRDDGGAVGEITSAALSPGVGAPIALGYVRREVAEPGQALCVATPGGVAAARVAALPFRGGSGKTTG